MVLTVRDVLAVAAAALTTASAMPTNEYVLHESRSEPLGHTHGSLWKRGSRLDSEAIVPLKIGLTQSNLDMGYDKLMEVSHPSSDRFASHMTEEEVNSFFAPAKDTIAAVHDWLVESGISETKIRQYVNQGWLSIDLPVSKVEELFMTEYHEVTHETDGTTRIGCDEYHVPKHLSDHIDYIVPGVKMSAPMIKRTIQGEKRDAITPKAPQNQHSPKKLPGWWFPPGWGGWPWQHGHLPKDLQNCDGNMTTACYRALYNIPSYVSPVEGYEAGLFETSDTYSQSDINMYFAKYMPNIPQGTHPKLDSVDGAVAPVPSTSQFNGGESDIDIDIIQSIIWPQTIVLYQADDRYWSSYAGEAGYLNTFLDAIDGSYCTYDAYGIKGDSPGIDPVYPDKTKGGYKGPLMCGTYKPTKVISISYGEGETDVPVNYMRRMCNEWMKLGLQGTTVFVSSGDYGVGGFPNGDSVSGCLGKSQTIFNPSNPATCPYVTSVGATQISANKTVYDPETGMDVPFLAPHFSSGGGFANYFPTPSYQKNAVAEYFKYHDPGHKYYTANAQATNIGQNGGVYNRGGRGIPDISANGANFRAFTNSTDFYWFGTSLAAPLWNGVVTLINQERAKIGKGSVGFINPTLYENTWALNDIKNGSNGNCGSDGFSAVQGWDPVTGLGTPKFDDLLGLWLALP